MLEPGTRTESGITDSKQDTGTITWQTPDGTPYTLTEAQDGIVHNSRDVRRQAARAAQLLDPAKFDTGDTATASHAWWSRLRQRLRLRARPAGHNFDLAIPEAGDAARGHAR